MSRHADPIAPPLWAIAPALAVAPGNAPVVPLPPDLGSGATRSYAPPWHVQPDPQPRADHASLAPITLRWRIISLLILGAYAVCFARELFAFDQPERWVTPALVWSALLLQAVAAALAWAGSPGVRRLRLIEWGTLGVACGLLVGMQVEQLAGSRGPAIAQSWSLPWFALIVAYGMLSPTPRRRRLAWAGSLAGLPLLAMLICAVMRPGSFGPTLWVAVVELGVWTGLAFALAAFASHRLDRLRDAAHAARQLGQYRLIRRLACGGMGDVYLAEHALLRRPCAVKVIRPERASDQSTTLRFEREVQAMASLTHWNTAEIYDYGHTKDGTFYYVMEYLPGLTLEAIVCRFGPMSAGRVLHLLRQVCAALREAHDKGLIHRDLKPSNVIVCERGGVPDVVKLLDFGLVRDAGTVPADARLTSEGAVIGTPAYMSPEQAAGHPPDARADLYALGAMAYFLLTGRPPFERGTPMEVLAAHLLEAVVPPSTWVPSLPACLETVILRCLAKRPVERYADVRELERALTACAADRPWTELDAEGWWRARGGSAAALAEAGWESSVSVRFTPAGVPSTGGVGSG